MHAANIILNILFSSAASYYMNPAVSFHPRKTANETLQ